MSTEIGMNEDAAEMFECPIDGGFGLRLLAAEAGLLRR
jgi:hypothetical protein